MTHAINGLKKKIKIVKIVKIVGFATGWLQETSDPRIEAGSA